MSWEFFWLTADLLRYLGWLPHLCWLKLMEMLWLLVLGFTCLLVNDSLGLWGVVVGGLGGGGLAGCYRVS